jgi:type IV pilus assembly protein PilQ
MGEVVNRRTWQTPRRLRGAPALMLPLALWALGCASAPPAPSASVDPTLEAAAAPADSAGAVAIRSVTVVERAPEAAVLVEGDGALVWTGYRDAEGRLVVELPGSYPAPGLDGRVVGAGIVAAVDVDEQVRAGRPLTRLTIETSTAAEHALAGEGGSLEIVLIPTSDDGELAYEPLPESAREAAAPPAAAATLDGAGELAAPAPAGRAPAADAYAREYAAAGTPEEPVVAPSPAGAPASRLAAVEVLPGARGTAVRIAGDGEFRYSTFVLDDPHRFVIDLLGVINESPRSTVPVAADDVTRVRVAQFKPGPDPVARVVFDLAARAVPQIERGRDGLLVRFGVSAAALVVPEPAPTGAGAESDRQVAALGGSEAGYQLDGEQEPAEEAEEVEETSLALAALEAESPQEPETGGQPAAETVMVEAPEEPAPPLPPTAAGLQPTTTDLEAFRRAQVAIPEPPAAAAGTQSFSPQTVGGTERRYVGEPITFSLRDADLVETLRAFAVISGLNMVVQPGVSGTVTVELEDVPWDQAFEQILKINGLGYELEGNVMRIAPTAVLQAEAEQRQKLEQARALSVPLLTVIKRLSYANAGTVAGLLQARGGVLSQRGSVIIDGRTNTLIIKELPAVMDTVIAVIENLDIAEPQVMIEARIVETRKQFTRTLGIQWGLDGSASPVTGNPTGLVFPATVDGSGGVNLITGGSNGIVSLALGSLAGTFNLDVTLQAAENEGLVNILSAPKVATLNNEQAEIQSGFQIPIQTVSNNTVSVQFVNATLRLQVTPQVTAEGTVLMDINIQKRNPEFALQVAGATAAPISTQEARTRVIVRDGGTTVIGGIYEVSTNEGEDRVPGLANIPILGHLFKNRRREDQNTELLIFITPRVMRL